MAGTPSSCFVEDRGEVQIIISDLYMPEMDGMTFLREVHRRWPDTAFIMLTGVAEVTTAVECLLHGASDYLSKPVLSMKCGPGRQRARKRRLVLENRFLQQSYQERLEASIRELDLRNKEQFVGQIQMAVRMLEKKDVYTRGSFPAGQPVRGEDQIDEKKKKKNIYIYIYILSLPPTPSWRST